VMDRIGERPNQAVAVLGYDQSHASLSHRGGGAHEHQQQGKKQAQVEPPPGLSICANIPPLYRMSKQGFW
ncbi:hypothetical protein, partial [Mesorhizobium sp. M7A.F.Ca.CA.004.12.1.1]|uniref:hypothetical protein n=1 Tax=Mesorhizobium sp. M7A.F.Ca.CA.004.12.1.1 TaxID=2496732 RepID=UPI0019D28D89